jgi:hypothetical protein
VPEAGAWGLAALEGEVLAGAVAVAAGRGDGEDADGAGLAWRAGTVTTAGCPATAT